MSSVDTKKNALSKSVNFSSGKLPASVVDGDINSYIQMVKKIPRLTQEEEYELAMRVQKHHDLKAAEKLIRSNLYLVVAAAYEYKWLGLPIADIISEGNIGLMKAVRKFEAGKGFRLSTYALWWIRATINDFVLSSWSLVKIGTKSAQRKLFFSLNNLKRKLGIFHNSDLTDKEAEKIADLSQTSKEDVIEMNNRLNKDTSLNVSTDDTDNNNSEIIDVLASDTPTAEEFLVNNEIKDIRTKILNDAIGKLNDREQEVLRARRLVEPAKTLDELSTQLGISKERVRQIECKAIEKLSIILMKDKQMLMSLKK